MMKRLIYVITMMVVLLPLTAEAQRIQQRLKRSVVAVTNEKAGTDVLVSWRRLAQEPEACTYNVYVRSKGTEEYQRLNAEPVSATNYLTKRAKMPYNSEVAVAAVFEGKEGEKSSPFLFKKQAWSNVFFDFDFESEILIPDNYKVPYVWPMDLEGKGKYDALLVSRIYEGGHGTDPGCGDALYADSPKLQAYTLDGKCLWTVDMGPNVPITSGQTDMVLTYDIDCDGRCEVIVKTSDGTRFWNHKANTWGKYAAGSNVADTDGDGIVNYCTQQKRNPPYYISILDAATGEEKYCAELKYSTINDGTDSYSRDNRANYANDNGGTDYAFLSGNFTICYFDGVRPSLAILSFLRNPSKAFHHYLCEWSFDWNGDTPSNWHHKSTWAVNRDGDGAAEFHQLRVADVNGDGIDEVVDGGFSWNPIKGQIAKPYIGHGDRFDVGDIDPDRPGLEVYAIQQTNLLGQLLYAAESGEHLKEWYLPAMGDVGRGRCMDVDDAHKGYEVFSTMDNLYDCKGNVIKEGSTPFPYEGIWWDADLQREQLSSPGGNGYGTNAMIAKYSGQRIFQISGETDYVVHTGAGNRPPFMGDMTGDWREEVIIAKQSGSSSKGIVGFSTEIPTEYSMYTLQEDPHYRLDCNTRGYYQSANTGFYLGGEMPYPPLPPVMTTDVRWRSGKQWTAGGDGFTSFNQARTQTYADGMSVIFDMSGDNSQTIDITGEVRPSVVYLMNPLGHDYHFGGTGVLTGSAELWKSMQGVAVIDADVNLTGKTIISEGTLQLNGRVAGDIDLRAKGTVAGSGVLNGNISFEGALNYEGCRIKPGSLKDRYATLTLDRSVTLPGNVFIEVDADENRCGRLLVNGDMTFDGINTITVAHGEGQLAEGRYVVAECTGTLTADAKNINLRGLAGVNAEIVVDGKQVVLVIHGSRLPKKNVVWSGLEDNNWNYKANNFSVEGKSTPFVTGDDILFSDASANRIVIVDEELQPSGMMFDFNVGTYTLQGKGSIGGSGGLTKRGKGELKMSLESNSFTGPLILNDGTLTVETLADGGKKSSIGAASATAGNLQLNGGVLKITAVNMATDRVITIGDTMEINVTRSNGAISLKGRLTGNGMIVKKGPGQLNLTYGGVNPFGGLIVKQGKVSTGEWNTTFGRIGSPMILAGGTVDILDVNDMNRVPVFNHAVTVVEGTNNTLMGSDRSTISGSFTGKGTLTIETVFVRNDIAADFSKFEGTLIASGEYFRLTDAVKDMKKTRLKIDDGSYVGHFNAGSGNEQAATTMIGSVESTATDCTLGNSLDSYEVGYNGEDVVYRGKLAAKQITKRGSGKWTLGSSESTSPIVVKEGTLNLNNSLLSSSTPTPATKGLITVEAGARLEGRGCANKVVVKKNGVVAASTASAVGTMKTAGDLTMEEGSVMEVDICLNAAGAIKNDAFSVNGKLSMNNAILHICVAPDVRLKEGDTFKILTGSGKVNGTVVVASDIQGYDVEWDVTALNTEGIIRVAKVKDVTAIEAATIDATNTQSFVTVGGMRVDTPHNGIYIFNGKKIIVK